MSADYESLAADLEAVSEGVYYDVSILANACALIYENMRDLNWCGFYLWQDNKLILGPFQGKIACTQIEEGKGVCGAAAARGCTVRVEDVHRFDGHIACDSASLSEIVIPLYRDSELFGVLDIDSPLLSRFTAEDQQGLEKAAAVIEAALASCRR